RSGCRATRLNRRRRGIADLSTCTARDVARVERISHRYVDDAENRALILDQCDVDGELAIARDEFLRAVQGIDEPVALPLLALTERNVARFFGEDGNVRCELAQSVDDDFMRAHVRERERR